MTKEQARSLGCGSKFTIRTQKWRKGRVIAYIRNGDPMNDAVGVLLDGNIRDSLKRSDFLGDEFVLETMATN